MELVEEVYKVADQLPKSEAFALCSQLKRAAVSVPSNIAEGQKRLNKAETIHFTGITLGSVAEVETQLIFAIGFTISMLMVLSASALMWAKCPQHQLKV